MIMKTLSSLAVAALVSLFTAVNPASAQTDANQRADDELDLHCFFSGRNKIGGRGKR